MPESPVAGERRFHAAWSVGLTLADCSHLSSAGSRSALPYSVPLRAVEARNYVQVHLRRSRAAAPIVATTGLVLRAVRWLPFRRHRRLESRAIVRALGATRSAGSPPMPPWS